MEMELCRVRLGFDNCLTVPSIGRSGGLASLWNNVIHLDIRSYSRFILMLLLVIHLCMVLGELAFY